jgi:antitoxin MazE
VARAIVGKWGRTLAVRISSDIAKAARLQSGARVDVEARDGVVVIRPADQPPDLEALFAGKTPQQWRGEYAGAFDWGADQGREAVTE